ncbi:hypothetical protein SO802_012355 [Lithocarpus litseifolius]|uniref:Uncharacterized protein n=1 Tax=Lithocarpus litseifolius TaxID=425828 RepID=A0AAW2D567_9ROSI
MSACSPNEDVESYVGEGKEDEIFEVEVKGDEMEENEGERNEGEEREEGEACTGEGTLEVGSSRSLRDGFTPSVFPHILDEQEDFIYRVTEIPLEERKCRDLITLDTLHLYCEGPEPMPVARKLFITVGVKMEAARQRVRAAAARKKEEEKKTKLGESTSAPKVIGKGASKRKSDEKDDRPPKKASVNPLEKVSKKPSPSKHSVGKGLMSPLSPVKQDSERRLLTHKEYAVEILDSIIKDTNADPYVGQAMGDLGDSGPFDLARAMVRMKALQVKGVTNEGEVKDLKEKLKEESFQRKKDQEAKETAERELTVLQGQLETAKANVVRDFKESQAYIDSCAEYYGLGFEDCLKQVKFHYSDLDLARVSMDDPLLSTPVGDVVPEETNGSTESAQDTRDDNDVLAQPARSPILLLSPSANPPVANNSLAHDAPEVLLKGDEAPQDPPAP